MAITWHKILKKRIEETLRNALDMHQGDWIALAVFPDGRFETRVGNGNYSLSVDEYTHNRPHEVTVLRFGGYRGGDFVEGIERCRIEHDSADEANECLDCLIDDAMGQTDWDVFFVETEEKLRDAGIDPQVIVVGLPRG